MKGPKRKPEPVPTKKQEQAPLANPPTVPVDHSGKQPRIVIPKPAATARITPEDLNLFLKRATIGREDILSALQRLSRELEQRGLDTVEIKVFGSGALMLAFPDARRMTTDLDALTPSADVMDLTKQIGEDLQFPDDWFNQDVQVFDRPTLDFVSYKLPGCENLRVSGLSPESLFAMKCYAGRDLKDTKDIAFLIEKLVINSLKESDAIYEKFYSQEPMPELSMVTVLECCDWRYE